MSNVLASEKTALTREKAKEITPEIQQMIDTQTKMYEVKLHYCEKRSHRTEYPYLYYTNLIFDNPAENVTAPIYYDGPNKVFCYNGTFSNKPIRKNLENDVSYDSNYNSSPVTSNIGALRERVKTFKADLPTIQIVENGKKIGLMQSVLDTYFDDNEKKITDTSNLVLDKDIIYYLQPMNMMQDEMMPYAKELPVPERKEKQATDPAVLERQEKQAADPAVPERQEIQAADPAVRGVRDPVGGPNISIPIGGKRRKTARKNKNKSKKASKKYRK